MGTAIDPKDLSTKIVVELFRDGLRAEAADISKPLTDPQASSRLATSKFVLTAYPYREVYFPHIVVQEAGDSSRYMERASKLKEHTYAVKINIYAKSNTDMFQIRDGIRRWFEDSEAAQLSIGFVDGTIGNAVPTSWDDTIIIKSCALTCTGKVYTAPDV